MRRHLAPDSDHRGTPYHRLAHLRPEWARWHRPLTTALTATAVHVILAYVVLVGTVSLLAVLPGIDPLAIGRRQGDPASPLSVGVALLLGAFAVVSALLGVRIGGWRPVGFLLSIAGRMRWSLMGRTAAWMLPALALTATASLLVSTPAAQIGPRGGAGAIAGVIVLVLLLSPLKAAGEEMLFRGIGQQGIGTWLRSPLWAILLPVPLSLIGRGYDADAGALAGAALISLCCGFLAWKTGGLETGIVLQIGTFGFSALLAPFGGPVLPGQGVSIAPLLVGAVIVTVLAARAFSVREGLGFGEPERRPEGTEVPAAARV